jgi:hypothetical protein
MSAESWEVMNRNDQRPLATEAVRSLEVRWILPGLLDPSVAGWFARFPAQEKSYEDIYLLEPDLRGLSVKVRAGQPLEVKAYGGSPGILEVAGRARGRVESWQKWSFPCDPPSRDSGAPPGWRSVEKHRRVSPFPPAAAARRRDREAGEEARCEVELTEIRTHGEAWWTLGFEAAGPVRLLHAELEAAAEVVFARALPGGMELGMDESMSYAQWLSRRPEAS